MMTCIIRKKRKRIGVFGSNNSSSNSNSKKDSNHGDL